MLGLPLAGYTAVLLSNTAVPVWQGSRRTLPSLFVASAVSGAASLLEMMELRPREARIVRRFAVLGKLAELASMAAVEREASRVERVGRALREGVGGALLMGARVLTVASLGLSLLPGHSRRRGVASGVLGTAGAVAFKFGVFHAGVASSADPRATFQQQRAGHGAEGVTGTAAVTGPAGGRQEVVARPRPGRW